MRTSRNLIWALLVFTVITCRDKERVPEQPLPKIDYSFTGLVTSTRGDTLAGAQITVNGKDTIADKQGMFSIIADSANRYVVNVRAPGYGLVSKVFTRPTKDYNYQLQPAFITTFDPQEPVTIRDAVSVTSCVGSGFKNLAFDAEYKKIPLVYDKDGNLRDFGFTPELKAVFDHLSGPPVCNPGASITIPANSVVNSAGEPVTERVTISITTIDLQSPDGMPGDYTYQSGNETGAMVSMGAVSIELFSENEKFNLNPKAKALLSVPVDPTKLKFEKKIPERIPVLYYNEKTGIWEQENQQMAVLNKKTNAYEAEINHFSSINLDFFTAPTCLRFRQEPQSGTIQSSFRMYAMTAGASFTTHSGTEDNCFKDPVTGSSLHLLYNAPAPGTEVCLVLTNNSPSPNAFYGIVITQTGSQYTSGTGTPSDLVYSCPCDPVTQTGSCWDATQTACDPACQPFSSVCVDVTMKLYTEEVILAAKSLDSNNARLKWIFKNDPGASFNYYFTITDLTTSDETRIPASGTLSKTYSVASPVSIEDIDLTAIGGISNKKVKVIWVGGAGDVSSNEVNL
ncbi:carboxypeptidase-like regulatory domain-containing protein [Oscillatoria amoena NRMC-F 0135]|nr:carboxypeptidase-like regulatory domain-containing protein [Oscillatoria amoena NRMC-F 0135]